DRRGLARASPPHQGAPRRRDGGSLRHGAARDRHGPRGARVRDRALSRRRSLALDADRALARGRVHPYPRPRRGGSAMTRLRSGSACSRSRAGLGKEFTQMMRARLTFALMVGVPIMQLILFGYAINADPRALPTAVVVAGNGTYARSFVAAL